jgi:phosphoglucosamine mutase
VGRITRFADAEDRYVLHLLGTLDRSLEGIHVVVDCAHGAASGISPRVFRDAGATVTVIGSEPDGLNINKGYGSTHLEPLQEAVISLGADFGIAHDGDADRTLAIDHHGRVIDGDHIMAILAVSMKAAGTLVGDTLVTTVMSNLGLRKAMEAHGIALKETAVGDRYVLEELAKNNWLLGGEGSGHLLALDKHTTGDGLVSALQVLQTCVRSGKTMADLLKDVALFPQTLINVRLHPGQDWQSNARMKEETQKVEAELGDSGRVLIRASGTEPLVRVMVEAREADLAQRCAQRIADTLKA